jgi:hypothetical protein
MFEIGEQCVYHQYWNREHRIFNFMLSMPGSGREIQPKRTNARLKVEVSQ